MSKKFFSCLLTLLLLSLAACRSGGAGDTSAVTGEPKPERSYILTNYAPLPDSVTGISCCVLDGDRLLLCCREETDGEHPAFYAAALQTDGGGFARLSLALEEGDIPYALLPDGQGGLWCLIQTPVGEDGASYTLRRFDDAGTETARTELDELLAEQGALFPAGYIPLYRELCLAAGEDGQMCLASRGGAMTTCLLFDREGQFLSALRDKGNPKTLITTGDGGLAVCSTLDGDATYSVLPLDLPSSSLKEGENLGGVSMVYSGGEGADYYLYDSSALYRCSLENGPEEKLFDWSVLGLSSGDAYVCPLSGGRFAVVAGAFSQTQLLSYEFCVVEPGEDTRTALTMLSLQPEDSILEAVALFNKSNPQYRVELESWFSRLESPSDEDWENAVTRLNTLLTTGEAPDLLDLNHMPADVYLRRGVLEDLFPWLEQDPEISMEDYFSNVFTALSIDGKLPYVTSDVSLFTVLADRDTVGDRRGWTLDEFLAGMDSGSIVPETASIYNPSWFLLHFDAVSSRFIDWETGKCQYDNGEFARFLEQGRSLLAGLGQAADAIEAGDVQPNCLCVSLFSVFDTAEYNALCGGRAVPIGYPSLAGGPAHFLEPGNKIGFSAACEHKEGAWAFVRSFLEPAMQESGLRFPYRKSSFEKLAEAAAEGHSIWASGMYRGDITQEDIGLAREVLSGAVYCCNSDQALLNTIEEQNNRYLFDSDTTAQEAAAAVQSKATMYVGEHFSP